MQINVWYRTSTRIWRLQDRQRGAPRRSQFTQRIYEFFYSTCLGKWSFKAGVYTKTVELNYFRFVDDIGLTSHRMEGTKDMIGKPNIALGLVVLKINADTAQDYFGAVSCLYVNEEYITQVSFHKYLKYEIRIGKDNQICFP